MRNDGKDTEPASPRRRRASADRANQPELFDFANADTTDAAATDSAAEANDDPRSGAAIAANPLPAETVAEPAEADQPPVKDVGDDAIPKIAVADSRASGPVGQEDNTVPTATGDSPDMITVHLEDHKSVGNILTDTRIARGLSVAEVARATNIRPEYIEYLEADDLAQLPPATIYSKLYLKSLCREYGLDAEMIVRRFEQAVYKSGHARARAETSAKDAAYAFLPAGSVGRKPGRAGFDLKLAWMITAVVVVVAVISVVYAVRNRYAREPIPISIQDEGRPLITDQDLSRLMPPEQLEFEELSVPAEDDVNSK